MFRSQSTEQWPDRVPSAVTLKLKEKCISTQTSGFQMTKDLMVSANKTNEATLIIESFSEAKPVVKIASRQPKLFNLAKQMKQAQGNRNLRIKLFKTQSSE